MNPSTGKIDLFLDNRRINKLSESQAIALATTLTSGEIQEVLKSTPNHKAPGPDGF